MLLSDVCRLSVAYIERPRKTKIGTEITHVTRDSDTISRSKGQRSRSPDRFTQRGLNAYGGCSGQRAWERIRHGKVLLRCVCSAAREGLVTHGEERGGGILCRHAHSLFTQTAVQQPTTGRPTGRNVGRRTVLARWKRSRT